MDADALVQGALESKELAQLVGVSHARRIPAAARSGKAELVESRRRGETGYKIIAGPAGLWLDDGVSRCGHRQPDERFAGTNGRAATWQR
jgi:hypothetical protein